MNLGKWLENGLKMDTREKVKAHRHNVISKKSYHRRRIRELYSIEADKGLSLEELKEMSRVLKTKKAVKQTKLDTKLFRTDDNRELNAEKRKVYERSVDEFYEVLLDLPKQLRQEKKRVAGGGLIYGKGGQLLQVEGGKGHHVFDGTGFYNREEYEEDLKKKNEKKKDHWRF